MHFQPIMFCFVQIASSSPTSAFSTVSLVLLFLLYPSVTLQATRPIACIEAHDGEFYVANDMSLKCKTSEHDLYVGLAFLQLVFITLGLPLLSAYIIFKRRKRLDTDSVQRRFSFLYNGYSKNAPWYETVMMLKKAALVFVSSFLVGEDSSNLRIFWGLLILLTALILHLLLEPFPDKRQLNLESFSIVLSIFMLLSGSVFSDEEGTNAAVNITLVVFNVTATVAFLGCGVMLASVDAWKRAKDTAIGERLAAKVAQNALSRKLAAKGQSAMSKLGNRISQRVSRTFSVFSTKNPAAPAAHVVEMSPVGGGLQPVPEKVAGTVVGMDAQSNQRDTRRFGGLIGDIAEMLGLNPPLGGLGVGPDGHAQSADEAALRRYSALKAEVAKWKSKLHPETHAEFWYNTVARELSYNKPACVEELEVMQAEIDNAWRMVPHKTEGWRVYRNAITGDLSEERPAKMPRADLESWDVKAHPSFRVPFFFNTRTDEVAWQAPVGWVPTKAQMAEIERIESAAGDSDEGDMDDGLFADDSDEEEGGDFFGAAAPSADKAAKRLSRTAGRNPKRASAVKNPLNAVKSRKTSVAVPAAPGSGGGRAPCACPERRIQITWIGGQANSRPRLKADDNS